MKKYTFFFKLKRENDETPTLGNLSLIAKNIVIANEYFKRLYVYGGDIDRCSASLESIEPKLHVYQIVESTSLD